jgi:uracil-DNA glycosylase family 4
MPRRSVADPRVRDGTGHFYTIGLVPRSSNPLPAAAAIRHPFPVIQAREAIVACELCPRLRSYCQDIGATRRRAYIDETYWARPVPGFGDPRARVLILGLAPGAHGANRTGRPFTGDGSGDFMYPVLHELGFASKPRATAADDGLKLRDAWIGSVVRCAPPGDKPTPQEIRNCATHLAAEVAALPRVRVVVCLGKIAWDGYLAHLLGAGIIERRSLYAFTHGASYVLPNGIQLLASYHPSLRNTNTGRLDSAMFARVFVRARELAGLSGCARNRLRPAIVATASTASRRPWAKDAVAASPTRR